MASRSLSSWLPRPSDWEALEGTTMPFISAFPPLGTEPGQILGDEGMSVKCGNLGSGANPSGCADIDRSTSLRLLEALGALLDPDSILSLCWSPGNRARSPGNPKHRLVQMRCKLKRSPHDSLRRDSKFKHKRSSDPEENSKRDRAQKVSHWIP